MSSSQESLLTERIREDLKDAMKAKKKDRLAAIRLILAAIKQREIDERATLDDQQVTALLDRMIKQRRESISQYEQAGRDDLAGREAFEIAIIEQYLPEALSEEELAALIRNAIEQAGANSMKEMGKVMTILRPKVQGRADMAGVSAQVKALLGG